MIVSQQLRMHSWAHTVLTPTQQYNYYSVLLAKNSALKFYTLLYSVHLVELRNCYQLLLQLDPIPKARL